MTEQIDLRYLHEVADGNQQVILKLLSVLQKNLQEIPPLMRSQLQSHDLELLRKTAHKLKSSTASIGVTQFTEILKAIEISAEQHETTEKMTDYVRQVEIYAEHIEEQITNKIIEIKLA